MKQSSVQWNTWNNTDLIEKNILEIGDGYRAKNSEMGVKGLPFARASNINNGFHFEDADILDVKNVRKTGSKISKSGDVVFTSKGTVGRFAFVKPETPKFVYSPQLCYWRIKNPSVIDPRFLFYWMHSRDFKNQIYQVKGLTDMADYVSLKDQRKMNIIAPPISIQHKIASILSAYDDLIENNTRRIAILEEMAQTIYREWFIYFRYPGHEKNKVIESGLGMIPEAWDVKNLGDLCNITMGQSPSSEFYNETKEGLPFHQGVTDFGKYFPANRIYCTVENRIAKAGDILFSVRAPVGRINVAQEKIVIGRGLSAIRSKTDNQIFILYQLKDLFQKEDIIGNGAIFQSVTKNDMYNIKLLSPSPNIISLFEEHIQPVFKKIEILTKKNSNLGITRNLLLPKLIAGEIDVEQLDIEIPDMSEPEELQDISTTVPPEPIDATQMALSWS